MLFLLLFVVSSITLLIVLQLLWELQVCKLQEQLESTIQKLEESKQLLKTNENGRFVQLDFSLCKNDPLISVLLKLIEAGFGFLWRAAIIVMCGKQASGFVGMQ